MVNDAETHVIAEPSVKSQYCEDGSLYISNLHSSNRILEPSQILDAVGDEVKRRSFSTDNCRTASLETRRRASCNNELATLSFGGLIEAACSSDDVFCSSDSKPNLYSNGSASSMSPLSSADRDSSVGEGNLSRLLYNMCLSPTAAGRPIRGSQSSYSSLGGGLQEMGSPTLEQAIMMGCRGYNRSGGGPCQQVAAEELLKPMVTAVGRAPGDRSPDALAELLNSLNCQQHKQQLHGSLAPQLVTAAGGSQQLGLPPSLIGARRAQFPLPRSQLSVATPSLAHRRGFIGDDLLEHSSSGGHLPYYDLPAKYGVASAAGRRSIEEAAKQHRAAAATNQATCTWSGLVPARPHRDAVYSCKVFLGGVPWDITESALASAFRQYGTIRVEWPGRDPAGAPVKGYVYVLFESERQVASMLNSCIFDASGNGNRYFKISSRRMRAKEVQVIPWAIADSNYVHCPSQQLDAQMTVFVGALHGMLTAETLARVLNDLFGGVLYAGIDTDKHKYPIGSGRVTFNNRRSFMWAVGAAFVEIKTNKFSKKVQIDPYLEDSLCSTCGVQQGPYFCRDLSCFRYFCRVCWNWRHTETLSSHKPLMRNSRSSSSPGRN